MPFLLRAWFRSIGRAVANFAALFLVFAGLSARAEWFARAWQSDEGLPNNTITGIAQTPDGYLWLATPSGLASFDGFKFHPFSVMELTGEHNRGILAMAQNKRGGVVLAMDRGAIICLDQGAVPRVFKVGPELPDLVPQNVVESSDGTIWISYRSGEIWRIVDDKPAPLDEKFGFPGGPGSPVLAMDRKGTLWVAKAGELLNFRDGKFNHIQDLQHTSTCMAPARDGGIWMCVGQQLFKLDADGKLHDAGSLNSQAAAATANVLMEDRSGALWIGTSSKGLYRLFGSNLEEIKTSHSEILSLREDSEGNLWVGTGGGGLNLIRPRAVELKGADAGMPEAAQSLCEDIHANIWATTQSGLVVRWDDEKWSPVSFADNWPGSATCMVSDHSGNLWIGTQHYGLFCERDGHFVSWGDTSALQGHTVRALLVDQNNDLWIGEEARNSFQRLHAGKLQNYTLPTDIRLIRALAQDTNGNIWIGTSKGVLLRVHGDKVEDMTMLLFGNTFSIRYLCATPDGSLWIGFAGWGLGRFKEDKFFKVSSAEGLFDDYISQIISDGKGFLWFGSNRGVFKISEQELNDLADGRATRVHSIYYGAGQGLSSQQANFGNSPGVLRSSDGRLWIPMRSGVVVVNPDSSIESRSAPHAVINRVALDDRVLSDYHGIMPPDKNQPLDSPFNLSPGFHRLEFDYTAPAFVAPENLQFRYRLNGVDKGWVETGPQRSAIYPRLPAGNYRFEVMASTSAGLWSAPGSIEFSVLPFFWETWTFRIGALAMFTLGVVFAVRYVSFRRLQLQLQQAREQAALHQERARIAKDIHDDLGANLTQITLLTELLRHDRDLPVKTEEHADKISSTARSTIKSLEEIVWAVNPRNDTLAQLMEYTGQFALDYLSSAGVRCRLDFPDTLPQHEAPTDVRHNLFLAIKEALNNTAKHAHAGQVWLRLQATEEFLVMEIEDDGCGFSAGTDLPGADGLRNMRQRMKEIGGDCRIESIPGRGTKINFTLPWRRSVKKRAVAQISED
jgi:signal transduction histidine kinase/ligand-binding sensor domain-containing protein